MIVKKKKLIDSNKKDDRKKKCCATDLFTGLARLMRVNAGIFEERY
jgi:hypothetical protein